jgi:cob(I)alamin adenosyltransferase
MPKLYTKTGDYGVTSLYDGSKKHKKSEIFDALGNLDELGSYIGLLCSTDVLLYTIDKYENYLREIQVKLLDIGSNIAVLDEKKRERVPKITEDDVKKIEFWIDECESNNSKLTEFLLCGVTQKDALCHVCRSISRRAERSLWKIDGLRFEKYGFQSDVLYKDEYKNFDIVKIDENIMKYMNRLSDFFFAYARVLSIGYKEIKVSDIKKKLYSI